MQKRRTWRRGYAADVRINRLAEVGEMRGLRKCAKGVVRAEGMSAEIAKRKLSRRCGFITLLS